MTVDRNARSQIHVKGLELALDPIWCERQVRKGTLRRLLPIVNISCDVRKVGCSGWVSGRNPNLLECLRWQMLWGCSRILAERGESVRSQAIDL
jgi:hypothetical protein